MRKFNIASLILAGLLAFAPAAFALHAYWSVQGDTLAIPDVARGQLRLWHLDDRRLEAEACRMAGRNLISGSGEFGIW